MRSRLGFFVQTSDASAASDDVVSHQVQIPLEMEREICDALDLTNLEIAPTEVDSLFSFAFVFSLQQDIFDPSTDSAILDFFLNDMRNSLERHVVGENEKEWQVSYTMKNPERLGKFSTKQLLFLLSVLHHTNMKKYMTPIIQNLLDRGMKFEEIKTKCKDPSISFSFYCCEYESC
jgi:hypothetical protein